MNYILYKENESELINHNFLISSNTIFTEEKEYLKINQNEKTALIIVDMQKQYYDPVFNGYVPNSQNLAYEINNVRKYFKENLPPENYIEIFTVDCLMKNSNFILNQDAIKIHPSLISDAELKYTTIIPIHQNLESNKKSFKNLIAGLVKKNLFIIEKGAERAEYSAFGETKEGINKYGRGKLNSITNIILEEKRIENVFVVGLAYNKCVLYTAADAALLKYRTYIVENATKSSVYIKNWEINSITYEDVNLKQDLENEIVKNKINIRLDGLLKEDEILKVLKYNVNGFYEKKATGVFYDN